jgi:hypothetical protein
MPSGRRQAAKQRHCLSAGELTLVLSEKHRGYDGPAPKRLESALGKSVFWSFLPGQKGHLEASFSRGKSESAGAL